MTAYDERRRLWAEVRRMTDLSTIIRRAVQHDPRSMYKLAQDATVDYATVHKFMSGERPGIRIDTASKLCATLRLELKVRR